jgi:HK97 family phage portal protein
LAYLGSLENSSTRANIEEQGIQFQRNTILPWVKRWEAELNNKLFTKSDRGNYYVRFNMDALLRGDLSSRYNSYAVARNWGWLSANDIRAFENMAPIDGGDKYLTPLNMIPTNEKTDEAE